MSKPNGYRIPTAAERELIEEVTDLSRRATYEDFGPQTGNGAYFLVRFGGQWGRVSARHSADQLRRIEGLASKHDAWPALNGTSGKALLVVSSYREFANRWRILEQGGIVVTSDGVTHVASADYPSPRSIEALECHRDISEGHLRRVRRADYAANWCAPCADSMARDVGPVADWARVATRPGWHSNRAEALSGSPPWAFDMRKHHPMPVDGISATRPTRSWRRCSHQLFSLQFDPTSPRCLSPPALALIHRPDQRWRDAGLVVSRRRGRGDRDAQVAALLEALVVISDAAPEAAEVLGEMESREPYEGDG